MFSRDTSRQGSTLTFCSHGLGRFYITRKEARSSTGFVLCAIGFFKVNKANWYRTFHILVYISQSVILLVNNNMKGPSWIQTDGSRNRGKKAKGLKMAIRLLCLLFQSENLQDSKIKFAF
jgi:hypothetical protein